MDLMSNPGAGVGREIATGERAEAELSAFISRRDTQRRRDEGERTEEEAWVASSRLQDARKRDENRAAWCEYHRGQAARLRRNLGALISHHEMMAERLQTDAKEDAA